MTTLAQLRQPMTADELRARIVAGLQAAGFPVRDWPPTKAGGLENGTIDMVAGTLADLEGQKLADAISGGFLDLAVGRSATFLAKHYYRIERVPATFTVQTIQLICAATAGPYSINTGDLVVTGPTGNHYRNLDGGRLESGRALSLLFQAEGAGAAYADPIDTLTILVTSLPGVIVTNPRLMNPSPAALVTGTRSTGQIIPLTPITLTAPLADNFRVRIDESGQVGSARYSVSIDNGKTYSTSMVLQLIQAVPGGAVILAKEDPSSAQPFIADEVFFWAATPIVQQGSDEETDERLASRSRARWLTLSDVPTPGTVALWAREAAPEVARVRVVSEPNLASRMLVYVAGSAGAAAPATVVAVQRYITDRLTPPEGATVLPVVLHTIVPAGSVLAPRNRLADVQAAAEQNWLAYLATVDIGGTVRLAELQQAVMDAGAMNFSGLTIGGAPNIVLGGTEVPRATGTLTTLLNWQAT
jgi:hypothetical protein